MKRILVILMCMLLLVSAACAEMTGGWSIEAEQSDAAAAALEKAQEAWVGASFEPVACLATQVVSGTNYCILCRSTTVTAEPVSSYVLVYVYQDLEGNAEILKVTDLIVGSGEQLDGAMEVTESAEITDEITTAFAVATEAFVGSDIQPVAFLSQQVVAGMNYSVLCIVTPVTADPVPHYAVVTVYADLEGGAEITDITDIDIGL